MALSIFYSMMAAQLQPDVVSCNATISSCQREGQWQLALELFDTMPQARIAPNVISFNAAIDACEQGGQWQAALVVSGLSANHK